MDENISQARVNEAIALFHSRGSGEQFIPFVKKDLELVREYNETWQI